MTGIDLPSKHSHQYPVNEFPIQNQRVIRYSEKEYF